MTDSHGPPSTAARSARHVPVSMCSATAHTADVGGFLVSDVWFPAGTVIPRHTHDRAVVGVMLAGGFDNRFASRTLDPTAGELFTEPGEEPHSNHVGSRGARVLVVQPDPGDEALARACRPVLDEIRSLRHAGVTDAARRLVRELRGTDELSAFAIESLALDLLVSVARLDIRGDEPGWLGRVDEIVRDRFREPLTVAEIAAEAGVHRGHLARAYRRHRGVPLSSHVRQLRLDWALERLLATDESLSSIAIRAGFADQSHLTREFKRRFGLPPGRYRASARHGRV